MKSTTVQGAGKRAYKNLLNEVLHLVENHRRQADLNLRSIVNNLYWSMGELILKKQLEHGWGKAVVEQLSSDLMKELGQDVSWSPRNLRFMRQMVEEYSEISSSVSLLSPPSFAYIFGCQSIDDHSSSPLFPLSVSHLPPRKSSSSSRKSPSPKHILQALKQLVALVPWGHNIVIMQRVKDLNARIYYLEMARRNHYSRAVLLHQIKSNAYGYSLFTPQSNFHLVLPEEQRQQTQESLKSVYLLDFLGLKDPLSERRLEEAMVEKVKRFMMELGYGFCFIGNQYRLTLGEKEYFIDLLFYHRILKCLVAVEIKMVEFEPEFIGKLDFCLQIIDNQLKMPDDRSTIGILLVPYKDQLEVEYALRSASNPIGVAQYVLQKQLPRDLIGKLPSSEEFRQMFTDIKSMV